MSQHSDLQEWSAEKPVRHLIARAAYESIVSSSSVYPTTFESLMTTTGSTLVTNLVTGKRGFTYLDESILEYGLNVHGEIVHTRGGVQIFYGKAPGQTANSSAISVFGQAATQTEGTMFVYAGNFSSVGQITRTIYIYPGAHTELAEEPLHRPHHRTRPNF
jgi:hypothetical protein